MKAGWAQGQRSRWPEWVIVAAIAALVVIGVAAIWGRPIAAWIDRMGGGGAEKAGDKVESAPAGPRL